MLIYRLGTARFPIWDDAGARVRGGRWNPPGLGVIYAAGSLSLAMLERLVQRGRLTRTIFVEAEAPAHIAIETLPDPPPSGWDGVDSPSARIAGREWIISLRTPILRVPSALVSREPNYLINPAHPDARAIRVGVPETLTWDTRLFGIPRPR